MAAIKMTMRVPQYQEMDFANEAECVRYIISTNIHRRHLTESQRGMITAELAKLEVGRPGKDNAQICAITQSQAAEMMNVSRRTAQTAKEVATADPALAAEVKAGNRSLHSAHQEIKRRSAPTKPVEPQTDPDQAADSVIDASEILHAEGWTPRARSVLAALAKLDDTEKTAIRAEVLKIMGTP
jgi:hypothetical protein